MLASVRDANASGAARRRQRRLRQWLRHERLSVAMALAEYNHHSALRRPTMARARGEESELYNGTGQTTPLSRAASTQYFSLGDDEDVLAARPLALDEQRPRVRVLRRTVEQIGDVVPLVPALADSVPQVVDQLVAVLARFDTPIADLVIEVPKVSCPPRCARIVQCTPQTVEQLVEVPTILSFISLQQQTAEQIVDIPVPGRGGGGGRRGLQSLLPGQNTTAQSAQIVDIPVPRGQDFFPRQGSTAFFAAHQPAVEYVAPAPVASCRAAGPGGGLQNFVPGQSSTAVFRDGGPGGGVQNFVAGQSSTALGGADDVDDVIWRSQELLGYTRREYSFSSEEEEEEEEEETEQMDFEEQPSRFQGHFRPRRFCASILRGGLCWRGSSCTFAHSYDELHPDVQGQW